MSFIISGGYAEVQILKTSESNPLSFWNILICICPNSEKVKLKRTFHIYICKKVQIHISMDKKYLIFVCTNVRTLHIFFIRRIFNGCELWIENSVRMVTVQYREACRVMPDSYPV